MSIVRRAVRRVREGGPYQIATYRGYGVPDRLHVRGRVLRDAGIREAGEGDSRARNIYSAYRRVRSRPLAYARVIGELAGATHHMEADDEGFLDAWVPSGAPLATGQWHDVRMELLSYAREGEVPPRAVARALVPHTDAAYGVISDLDDTVLLSRSNQALQAATLMAFGNARTRLPFPGVAAFYRALAGGVRDEPNAPRNPLFLLSSSPWNLYDLIEHFLDLQGIPAGPILLRDWDLGRRILALRKHLEHKGTLAREILHAYPTMPFILLGDTAQHDPEIYAELVHDFPGRILAVYIRNVTASATRSDAVQQLAEEVRAAGSALVLADDTVPLAEHAAEHGWIDPESLDAIRADGAADEGRTDEKEALPGIDAAQGEAPTVIVEPGVVDDLEGA